MSSPDYLALVDPRFYSDPDLGYIRELTNALRTETYMANGLHPSTTTPNTGIACGSLAELLDLWNSPEHTIADAGYNTPVTDGAGWYNAVAPQSAGFAGMLVTEINGLETTPMGRDPIPRDVGGAYMGQSTFVHRVIEVTGVLIGRTCCSTAAGYRYLAQTLSGKGIDGCESLDLWFLDGCPSTAEEDCLDALPAETASPWLYTTDVTLLEGLNVVEAAGTACGDCGCSPLLKVEFTLGAGNPFLYGATATAYDNTPAFPADMCGLDIDDILWGESTDCAALEAPTDPYNPLTLPPSVAPDLASALCTPFATYRQALVDPFSISPYDRVPQITVTNATGDIHHIGFRICYGDWETTGPCEWDSGFALVYVPPSSFFSYDGVRRTLSLTLDDGTVLPAGEYIHTLDGLPIQVPVIGAFQTMTMVLDVDAYDLPDGIDVTVQLVDRFY